MLSIFKEKKGGGEGATYVFTTVKEGSVLPALNKERGKHVSHHQRRGWMLPTFKKGRRVLTTIKEVLKRCVCVGGGVFPPSKKAEENVLPTRKEMEFVNPDGKDLTKLCRASATRQAWDDKIAGFSSEVITLLKSK